jgi:exopolysaccharide production protein ExoZ
MNTRLYSLDYLRGLCAFGIMIYHYLLWIDGVFTSDQFLGRVGVYGVAIFYVLSGLTLYHVYEPAFANRTFSFSNFFKKRIYRIFPLLWLATFGAIILSQKLPNVTDLILNLTGLFGFFRWHVYFSTGVWSIGNELVFYTLFPIIALASVRKPIWMASIALITAALHSYYAYVAINPWVKLQDQWNVYVNPLNQVAFFVFGCMLGYLTKTVAVNRIVSLMIMACGIILFIATPARGNAVSLVEGNNRWIFTVASLMICLGVYKSSVQLPGMLHTFFKFLGESSYSLYLLHPLVFTVWAFLFHSAESSGIEFPRAVQLIVPVAISISLSYFVYRYFEQYFMRLGRHSSPGSPS